MPKLHAVTSKALEKLRTAESISVADLWSGDFNKFVTSNPDCFAATRFDTLVFPVLRVGSGREKGKFDKDNAKALYRALSDLTPVESIDERFWVSVTLQIYPDYLRNRWPCSDVLKLENHLQNHLFATSARKRFRDQAVSRLWWAARFVNRNLQDVSDHAFEVFFDLESDVYSQLSTRPTLVSVKNLAKAVIEITHGAFLGSGSTSKIYIRDEYRKFLSDVDLASGRQLLPHQDYEEIYDLVKKLFDERFPAT
ncbi:MAG: hypothetical protein EBT65_05790 [Actinobacteria bacterium]|nr:hypothetical protein [Actinomycetota bacterium]